MIRELGYIVVSAARVASSDSSASDAHESAHSFSMATMTIRESVPDSRGIEFMVRTV